MNYPKSSKYCKKCGELMDQKWRRNRDGLYKWVEPFHNYCHRCNKWDKNSPKPYDRAMYVQRCYAQMNQRPDLIEIHFVCPHDKPKLRHHNSYDEPFVLWLVCKDCHGNIHKAMRYIGYSPHKD